MKRLLEKPWVQAVQAIYCSTERKATDGARVLAQGLGLEFEAVEMLGENDRSATGYLPRVEFEALADQFFARPHESVRGWERAIDAQRRIVLAMGRLLQRPSRDGAIAVISHGAVGALYLCHLKHCRISREEDQPATNGGNYFTFQSDTLSLIHGWKSIED